MHKWWVWEPKMCRLAWQLLGMLGNALGMLCNVLGMLCNVLGMLPTSSASSACFLQGPRSPTSKKPPPHLLSYKLWSQGSSIPPSFHTSKSSCAHTLNLVKCPVELTPSFSIKSLPEELFLIYVSSLFSLINTSSLLSPPRPVVFFPSYSFGFLVGPKDG